jgi:hypothetical protein
VDDQAPAPATTRTRVVAALVAALALLDLVSLAALHVLRTDVDPVARPTSDYALGDWGWLTLTATVGVALAGAGLIGLVGRGLPSTTLLRFGLRLLGLFVVVKAVQAFFQIDAAGQSSTDGLIHDIMGNLAFFALPPAAVLISAAWAKAGRPLGAALRWIAVALAVAVVAVLAIGTGGFGLTQRIYLVLGSGWLLTGALAVLRAEPHVRVKTDDSRETSD